MIRLIVMIAACGILFSCKSKKKTTNDPPFPVVSYLKGQVKQMDSTPHQFTRIETINDHSDTSAVSSADFKKYAKEFTDLPDISKGDVDDYDQDKTYDDYMGKSILTYTASDADDEIRRESVILGMNAAGDGIVETIIISTQRSDKDSTIAKEMTWHASHRFQIVTKSSKPGQQEQIRTLIIKWD